jgi:hypothetical protein
MMSDGYVGVVDSRRFDAEVNCAGRVLRVIAPATIFITRFNDTSRIPGFGPRLHYKAPVKADGGVSCHIAFEVT